MIYSNFWSKNKASIDTDNKILVIAANHTGNNIFCTPAIKLLKKHLPSCQIDVVSLNKLSTEVFYGNPSINEIFISKSSRFINKLAMNYSKVICLHREVLRMLPGLNTSFLVAPDYVDGTHRAEQMLQFVARLTNHDIVEEDRAYVITSDAAQHCLLDNFEIKPADILVCMHLGCGRTKTHGWNFFKKSARTHKKLLPIKTYVELANALIAINPNIKIAITGTENEQFLGEAFNKSVPRTINLIAKTSISQLYQLMSTFKLYISQDCGILHVASASNVPILGLFGPTNPANTGPFPLKNNHIIIKKAAMDDINLDQILSAALNLLSTSKQTTYNDGYHNYKYQTKMNSYILAQLTTASA